MSGKRSAQRTAKKKQKTMISRIRKHSDRFNKLLAIGVAAGIMIAAFFLLTSRAAPVSTAIEAEQGSRSGDVQIESDTAASAGQGVRFGAPASTGLAKYEPPDGKVYIGMGSQPSDFDDFDNAVGISNPALYGYYSTPNGGITATTMDTIRNRPLVTALISWHIIFRDGRVTNGSSDGYIRDQANTIKNYGKPVFLRPAWEMNGDWYPNWDLSATSTASYKSSWRRMVQIFKEQGVQNVAWVWCPNNGRWPHQRPTVDWYPGDDVVDWICVDAYAWDGDYPKMMNSVDGAEDLTKFARSKNKPMMLGEWGPNSAQNSTASSVNGFFDWAERNPDTVKALVYFHFGDFKISRSDRTIPRNTFRSRISNNSRYIYTIYK